MPQAVIVLQIYPLLITSSGVAHGRRQGFSNLESPRGCRGKNLMFMPLDGLEGSFLHRKWYSILDRDKGTSEL